jgi:hypothetical protein
VGTAGLTNLDLSYLRLLFQRLTWPSVLVRERSCVAIASLLSDNACHEITTQELLKWLADQKLESHVTLGLLALCRAKAQGSEPPTWTEVSAAIKKPSILSQMIARDLYDPALVPPPNIYELHSGTAPGRFIAEDFFEQYRRNFLPEIYSMRAEKLEKRHQPGFVKQWSYEWSKLVSLTGIGLSRPSSYFWRNPDEEHAIFDLPMSEVYRSSFLRALGWAASKHLDLELAMLFAAESCPVDIDLWNVIPVEKPTWWPEYRVSKGPIDLVPGNIIAQLEAMWHKQRAEDWVVAHASGRVFESEDSTYDIEIIGAIQSCGGPVHPELTVPMARSETPDSIIVQGPSLLRLEGSYTPETAGKWEGHFSDWSIWRLAAPLKLFTSIRWQYWRGAANIWLPAPFLVAGELSVRCTPSCVLIENAGKEVGRWSDWSYRFEEKLRTNLHPSTGEMLCINQTIIDDAAERVGGTFAWLCRITTHHRKTHFGPYEAMETLVDFGTTRLLRD